MLSRSVVARCTKPSLSSVLNTVLPLRQGKLTTPTTTWSYIADARWMTSRWPKVTGSKVPGQIAMRLSGAIDSYQGVAVAALICQRQFEVQGRPSVAFGDHAR